MVMYHGDHCPGKSFKVLEFQICLGKLWNFNSFWITRSFGTSLRKEGRVEGRLYHLRMFLFTSVESSLSLSFLMNVETSFFYYCGVWLVEASFFLVSTAVHSYVSLSFWLPRVYAMFLSHGRLARYKVSFIEARCIYSVVSSQFSSFLSVPG